MRYLIIILTSLILVGCAGPQKHYISIENFYGEESKYNVDDILNTYSWLKTKQSVYQVNTNNLNNLETLRDQTIKKCKREWSGYRLLGFTNLEEGCIDYTSPGEAFSAEQTEKRKQFRMALAQEKKKFSDAKDVAIKKHEEDLRKSKLVNLELKYADQCKKFKQGTAEYSNCLFEREKLASAEQKRLATLPATERYAYTCEKTYGFRKGSETFKECVFKIMTTEHEMQTQINQRRIAELESRISGMERSASASNAYQGEMLEIERMKAKAMQDQVSFARNKDITDTLLGISSNLLNPPRGTAPNAPQMFNCQIRKFGGFDQIQCF